MPSYRVTWEIDIETERGDPAEAAEKAWEHVRRPDSTANVFDVYDEDGNVTRVDLQEVIEERSSPRP